MARVPHRSVPHHFPTVFKSDPGRVLSPFTTPDFAPQPLPLQPSLRTHLQSLAPRRKHLKRARATCPSPRSEYVKTEQKLTPAPPVATDTSDREAR